MGDKGNFFPTLECQLIIKKEKWRENHHLAIRITSD